MITDTQNYLVDNILKIQDQMSMAHSIEARTPLLDHRLVEHAFNAPSHNDSFKNSKDILKKSLKDHLPQKILSRNKMGFNGPTQYWTSLYSQEFIKELKNNPVSPLKEFINLDHLFKIFQSPKVLSCAHENLFSLYIFNKWYRHHVE